LAYPCCFRVICVIRVLAVNDLPDHATPAAMVDDRAAGVPIVVAGSTAAVHRVQISSQ
jgi:2,3-bisphosphoglycerate-independent phosphoglycerate mutase